MSLYEEIWSEQEYEPRQTVYLNRLLPNHLKLIKKVNFGFDDYKVYERLGCFPAERALIQCANKYGGTRYYFESQACHDVHMYFLSCIKTQEVMATINVHSPESFATNEYSRKKYNISEIL